jgi:hypothetical protein
MNDTFVCNCCGVTRRTDQVSWYSEDTCVVCDDWYEEEYVEEEYLND